MDAKKYCPTVTIDDQPAAEDTFGSHEPLARAIFEMVKTEEGGKAIALEGPWGSGKSTVVRLLKDLCDKQEERGNDVEVGVFVFDAWAHRGDPLRHSFLQRLNDYLDSINWLDKGHLEKDLKRLSGQEEEVTTEPILTIWGSIVLLGTFLASAVIAVFSLEPSLEGFPDQLKSFEPWLVYILAAPFLVIAFVIFNGLKWCCLWLKSRPTLRLWKSEFWLGNLPPRPKFAFLLARISNPAQYTIIHRNPDPTSVEFTKTFAKAVDKALAKRNRRLIVVVDNLDRLDAQEALSIWATMKAFFEPGIFHDTPWLSRFWLVVPYDPNGIRHLWEQTKVPEERAIAFIEKTFQVRFYVPTPVLADRYDFLHKQLQKAFPEHDRTELETVLRLYRLCCLMREKEERSVTPRDIKVFVNNLGALHRQWQDEKIPLSMQALYILFREKIERNPRKFLTTQDSIPKPVRLLLEESIGEMRWAQYLGALHFNVRPEKVMHLLINEDIEKALVEGQGEALLDLHGYPGFWTVLESVIEDRTTEWAQKQPGYLGTAAAALAQLEANFSHRNSLWGLLRTAIREVQGHWVPLGKTVAQGLCAILEHSPGEDAEQTAKQIIAVFSRTSPPDDEGKGDLWQDWYQGVLTFVREAQRLDLGKILRSSFRISGPVQAYLQVMALLSQEKDGVALAPYFLPADPNLDVAREIAALCNAGKFSSEHLKAIRLMLDAKMEWSWQEIIVAAKDRLWSNPNLQSAEVNHLLWFLLDVFDDDPSEVEISLADLAKGRIFHYLHRARSEGNHETVALCTTILLEYNPRGDLLDNWQYAANGQSVYRRLLNSPTAKDIETIARVYSKRGWITPLLVIPERNPNTRPLVLKVVEYLANHDREIFSAKLLARDYDRLKGFLPREVLQSLIKENRESVIAEVIQRPFDLSKAALYYAILSALSRKPPVEFLTFLREGLQEIDKETWEEQLDGRGSLIEILLAYPKRRKIGLGYKLGDAIKNYAQTLLEDKDREVQYSVEEVGQLLNALGRNARITTLRSIRSLLLQNSRVVLTPVLTAFGPHLYSVLGEEKIADEVVRVLFSDIVEYKGKDEEELRWLLAAVQENPLILHNARTESVKILKERVVSALESNKLTETVKKICQEIRSLLEL